MLHLKLPSLASWSAKLHQIPYRTTVLGVTASFALIGFLVVLIRRSKQDKQNNEKQRRRSEILRERDRTGRIPLPNSPNGG